MPFESVHHAIRISNGILNRVLRRLYVDSLAEYVAALRSNIILLHKHLYLVDLGQHVEKLALAQMILLAHMLDVLQQVLAALPLLVDLTTTLQLRNVFEEIILPENLLTPLKYLRRLLRVDRVARGRQVVVGAPRTHRIFVHLAVLGRRVQVHLGIAAPLWYMRRLA